MDGSCMLIILLHASFISYSIALSVCFSAIKVVALLPVVSGILMIAFTANSDSNGSSSSDSTSSSSSSSSNSSQPLAYTAGAVSFAGGALVIIWVIVMLVLRFLNIGLLNLGSKYFLAVVSYQYCIDLCYCILRFQFISY